MEIAKRNSIPWRTETAKEFLGAPARASTVLTWCGFDCINPLPVTQQASESTASFPGYRIYYLSVVAVSVDDSESYLQTGGHATSSIGLRNADATATGEAET